MLHVDGNDYYGGSEAAFSLQDADDWVAKITAGMWFTKQLSGVANCI